MGYGNGFHVRIYCIIFSEKGLAQANANDKYISEFFQNVKVWLRENDLKRDLKFTEMDKVNFIFIKIIDFRCLPSKYQKNCS